MVTTKSVEGTYLVKSRGKQEADTRNPFKMKMETFVRR